MKRLEENANTFEEVKTYYTTRALQLATDGFVWDKKLIKIEDWGILTKFSKDGETFDSIYVYEKYRGQKKAKGYLLNHSKNRILTVPSCHIESFLKHINKPYLLAGLHTEEKSYKMIEDYYGDKVALRSQVFLMNHIDEGLIVLSLLGASLSAKMAFCLHPLFQADEDLKNNYDKINEIDPKELFLAMEYRNIANAYLSPRNIKSVEEIMLSPIADVNMMLIADKIQNYKDFLLYHKKTHKRSDELDLYFNNWLSRLEIKEEFMISFEKYL